MHDPNKPYFDIKTNKASTPNKIGLYTFKYVF